ncbi:hypothetical protein F4X86_04105 [Candidatus Saccharibacteria bacterium]|nr:hypothetical protein [Candidatus Saccharibacteria bacterium]
MAFLASLVPIFGPLITVPSAAAGISLSAVACGKSKQRGNPSKIALTGLLLSITSLPVMVVNTVIRW